MTHDRGLVAYNNRCMLTLIDMFVAWSQWVAIVRHKPKPEGHTPG
jgi:hypothetical protein